MNRNQNKKEECEVHAIWYCNRTKVNNSIQVQYNQIPLELKYLHFDLKFAFTLEINIET